MILLAVGLFAKGQTYMPKGQVTGVSKASQITNETNIKKIITEDGFMWFIKSNGDTTSVGTAIGDQVNANLIFLKLAPDTVTKTANFTVSATEVNKEVHNWKATSLVITIPQNLSDWPVGTYITFEGWGAGIMVFKKAAGVTFVSEKDSIATARKGQHVTVKKLAANKYGLIGPLTD